MSFNGSGTFNINTAGQPVVNGTTITDTAFNALIADLASGLTNAVTRDGQSPATANLPMGNNKHTGVSDATARTHYCSAGQAQDNTFDWLTSVSGADTITASAAIGLAAYAAGQCFRFASVGANTGAVTLNVNSLGAKAVTKNGTTALVAGDIPSGAAVEVIYDGTRFQLIRGGAMSGANSDITSLTAVTGITAGTVTVAAGDLVYVQDVSAANELKVVTAQSIADVGTGKRLAQSPVVATLTTVATTTANIPQDDTIPQITEGTEILTAAITPVNASNTLFITCQVWASMSAVNWCSVALFKDSTANALAAGRAFINGTGQTELITFSHSLSAGSTSAITFRIRVGAQASETVTVNGAGGVRIFGGAMYSRITIEEITA